MYSSTIRRYAMKQWDLNYYEYEILLFLHGVVMLRTYFTTLDFKVNNNNYNWDRKRMLKLIDKNWIVKSHDMRKTRHLGDHDKYTMTTSGKIRMTQIYNYHIGAAALPSGTSKTGKIADRKGKKHKKMSQAYDQMRRDKDFLTG